MSLKENIEFIKEDISTEEKFFENFFKLEKVWAKYKVGIIGVVSLTAIAFVGIKATNYLALQDTIKANNAFNILMQNPADAQAKEILASTNPKLLDIIQNRSQLEFLKEITQFNIAVDKNDIEAVNKTILNNKFLLKDYAIFQKALIQTINNKFTDAKETLKIIPQNSSVSQLSSRLSHYLLTK